MKHTAQHRKQRSGFSLIEISLALLVIGVGLVSVIGLFPAGLNQARGATDETQAALFADEVFEGYQAWFAAFPDDWSSASSVLLPPSVYTVYMDSVGDEVKGDGTIRTYVRRAVDTDFEAFRYRLTFTKDVDVLEAVLEIWSGQYGSTTGKPDFVFYTEYFDFRN